MKKQNIEIDINKLNVKELEMLKKMLFDYGENEKCKVINERIAYLNGWLSSKKEKEYYDKYCA